jgi:hypothetical protein
MEGAATFVERLIEMPDLEARVVPDLLIVFGLGRALRQFGGAAPVFLEAGRDAFARLITVANDLGCDEAAVFFYTGYESACRALASV